jgi:hypothetical protein
MLLKLKVVGIDTNTLHYIVAAHEVIVALSQRTESNSSVISISLKYMNHENGKLQNMGVCFNIITVFSK